MFKGFPRAAQWTTLACVCPVQSAASAWVRFSFQDINWWFYLSRYIIFDDDDDDDDN
jgi:hypothetical protein